MPFLPKVPHIVGDDDDAENQTQVTNGSDNDATESSSSYDDDSDDEGSNESTQEEEEDWSNNISYIVRTPEHVPEQLEEPPIAAEIVAAPRVEIEIDLTQDEQVEQEETNEEIAAGEAAAATEATLVMDCEEQQANSDVELVDNAAESPLKVAEQQTPPTKSPVTPQNNSKLASPAAASPAAELLSQSSSTPVEDEPNTPEAAATTAVKVASPVASQNVTPLANLEQPRRLSLRSAYRSNATKSSAPSAKSARNRQRQRQRQLKAKLKLEDSTNAAITIGARVAKRSRHLLIKSSNSSADKSAKQLAKPVEVTEYFTNISATLVSHRVNLLPFLSMRKRIDRLVGEAIAQTKSA